MKKNKNLSVILILFSLFLYSCQTATEALQGKKRSDQSDEFLVEKKNPLAMPPDFDKLPTHQAIKKCPLKCLATTMRLKIY